MILINKNITITGGTAPYTFSFDADCGASTGCVTIRPLNGTTSSVINAQFEFFNTQCIADCTITLNITDAEGCVESFVLSFDDPCQSFVVSPITFTAPYTFSTTVTGGTPPYTYNWNWNQTAFTSVNPNTNNPVLSLIPKGQPVPMTVYLQVTDSLGCVEEVEFNYQPCVSMADDETAQLICQADGSSIAEEVALSVTLCPNVGIDWSTLNFSPAVPGITITPSVSGVVNEIDIHAIASVTPGIYVFSWTVNDNSGVTATPGTLTVIVPTCQVGPPIVAIDKQIQIDCGLIVGNTIDIDLTQCVISQAPIDWSTFTFIEPVPPSTTTGLGGTVAFDQVTATVTYTIPQLNGIDYFEWTVCNTNGDCANSSVIAIVLACNQPPVANNDADCASCGESRFIDVLANDVFAPSLPDPNSIMIVSPPTNGVAVVSGGGIIYTANSGYSGADQFTYQVANTNGTFSNVATVDITVICAGIDGSTAVCS